MSEAKRTDIGQLGEFGLINKLTKDLPTRHKGTLKAVGDDAAVLDAEGKEVVVSTDLLVEGIHFDLMYMPLKHLGYKAVIVNLSDIYAMNATPKQITVSLSISNRFSVEAIEELYDGIKTACRIYNIDLVGGDTTSSLKGLVISVTAIGYADKDKIVYRNTAREGDLVCVSGDLGAAYMGLQILEREKQVYLDNPDVQPELKGNEYLIGRQLKPEARKDVIEHFAKINLLPTAMIDVSDGVSSDLLHICTQSGLGCHIYEAAVPVQEATYNQAVEFNMDPITAALNGGEDYELLFSIDPRDEGKVQEEDGLSIIGQLTKAEDGYILESNQGRRVPLVAQGWKHLNGQ